MSSFPAADRLLTTYTTNDATTVEIPTRVRTLRASLAYRVGYSWVTKRAFTEIGSFFLCVSARGLYTNAG